LTLVVASPVYGQVLYQENFNNSSGANQAVNAGGWQGFAGPSATVVTSSMSSPSGDVFIAGGNGNPSPPAGYLASANSPSGNFITVVNTFTNGITIPNMVGNEITFRMGNSSTDALVRIVIQIGGDGSVGSGSWYANSGAWFTNAGYTAATFSSADPSAVTFGINVGPADVWRPLTLVPGSTMSLSTSTTTIATSTITGIGFIISGSNQVVRIDNLTVVPEPGTVSMLALGGLMIFGLLRRRRLA
jgi:hypothetical protein